MIIKDDPLEIQQYLFDEANNKGECEKVFIVETKNDIIDVLKNANLLGIPVTICGNHTSLTGSSVPVSGWVISTERLNKIVEVNCDERFAIIEPGVTLRQLQELLKPLNLFFPPDPTETSCFIGGMVGTNASGARSFKYGPTRNFIEEMEIILPDGAEVTLARSDAIKGNHFKLNTGNKLVSFDIPETYVLPDVKNTVGYYLKNGMDLLDLFIGAEGTLGVVSRIKLKLIPAPESIISMVIFFDDIGKSFEFLTRIKALSKENFAERDGNKIDARLIEFYDQKALALLRPHLNDIPEDCKAAFWIEQECKSADEHLNILLSWENFLTASNIPLEKIWLGADEKDRAKIIDMRHLLPILVNDLVKINGMKKMGTDIALSDHEFEAYYYDAIKSVEEVGVDYVMFGHFGNSHIHLNMLPVNTDQMIICKNLYAYLCSEAIRLGGTFSAEHGVGKIKKDYLKMMYPQKSVAFMQRVKLDFDPKNIIGLGNIF